MGSDLCRIDFPLLLTQFQLTLPVWGATSPPSDWIRDALFQLTLPVWGATNFFRNLPGNIAFQLTLPVWGATSDRSTIDLGGLISTRAPRVGSDLFTFLPRSCTKISTHAPRVGSDRRKWVLRARRLRFQLTLPVWGATHRPDCCKSTSLHFNSRSPCGERRQHVGLAKVELEFQLTLPVWGATRRVATERFYGYNFNSRSPCGERQDIRMQRLRRVVFQLTLPVWGATKIRLAPYDSTQFQLTLPVWGATAGGRADEGRRGISTHAPRVGSDSTPP